MTALLSPIDVFRRDSTMTSIDDNNFSSSADWKAKYMEVADMLAETRAELDEFHTSSKELEEELIKEIDRTEKAQQDLKVKVARTETEREEWKSKFISLQTTHNTTTASLQRELDQLRQEHQKLKIQLRELELGNDDLERNERAVTSSLADIEAKYSRALEEKILLEHELLDKANMEEEFQRLKDDLRDATVEISILKDQLVTAQSRHSTIHSEVSTSSVPSSLPHISPPSTDENLLNTPPPPDLQLSEISPSSETVPPMPEPSRPSTSLSSASGQSMLLQRAGFQSNKVNPAGTSPSSITRSRTLPVLAASSRNGAKVSLPRPHVISNSSSMASLSSTAVVPATATKSKGVQMVSEMRARVKNLEQKIHTRVPRIRMGSNAGRQNASALAASTVASGSTLSSLASKASSLRSNTAEDKSGKLHPQRHSADIESSKRGSTTPSGDTSGWVLIMEDSPSPSKEPPAKDTDKGRRRLSSPTAPTAYRHGVSTSASSPSVSKPHQLQQSTTTSNVRRPQSRLSGASLSTTATISSIPTPSSRPSTPTFLPVPSASLYASTAGKRSTGPGLYGQAKRSSLGSNMATSPTPPPDTESRLRERPLSYTSKHDREYDSNHDEDRQSSRLPSLHANVTVRAPSKLPTSTSSVASFAQSRIGKPSGIPSGRKSVGLELSDNEFLGLPSDKKGRSRSSSNALGVSKNAQ